MVTVADTNRPTTPGGALGTLLTVLGRRRRAARRPSAPAGNVCPVATPGALPQALRAGDTPRAGIEHRSLTGERHPPGHWPVGLGRACAWRCRRGAWGRFNGRSFTFRYPASRSVKDGRVARPGNRRARQVGGRASLNVKTSGRADSETPAAISGLDGAAASTHRTKPLTGRRDPPRSRCCWFIPASRGVGLQDPVVVLEADVAVWGGHRCRCSRRGFRRTRCGWRGLLFPRSLFQPEVVGPGAGVGRGGGCDR